MLAIHDYGAQHEKLTPDQVANNQNHWKQGLYLVFQMKEHCKPWIISLWKRPIQCKLSKTGTKNSSHCIQYKCVWLIPAHCPLFSQDNLFIRYTKTWMYRGFTSKILPTLMEKYLFSLESSYLWKVWTEKDLKSEGKLMTKK